MEDGWLSNWFKRKQEKKKVGATLTYFCMVDTSRNLIDIIWVWTIRLEHFLCVLCRCCFKLAIQLFWWSWQVAVTGLVGFWIKNLMVLWIKFSWLRHMIIWYHCLIGTTNSGSCSLFDINIWHCFSELWCCFGHFVLIDLYLQQSFWFWTILQRDVFGKLESNRTSASSGLESL